MTEASIRSLDGLRDFSTLPWYVVPLRTAVGIIHAVPVAMNVIGMGIPGWVY